MINILIADGSTTKAVTPYVGSIEISDNINSLGACLSFDFMANRLDTNYAGKEPKMGDKVIVKDDDVAVFYGVIASVSNSDLAKFSYKAYDYAFYLNKSEAIIQYNKVPVSDAIQELCNLNNIPVYSICPISTVISKMYDGTKISDIIKDLLKMATEELGIKYRLEMLENKLYIAKYEELIVPAWYKPASNIGAFDATKVVGGFSYNASIDAMCNNIIIVSSKEKHVSTIANVEDVKSQEKYGVLTKVEKVDDKKIAQAKEIANNKLKELNKVKKTFSVTIFGDKRVRAGRSLKFDQPVINLVGTYLVVNCTHKYSNNSHVMTLELEV